RTWAVTRLQAQVQRSHRCPGGPGHSGHLWRAYTLARGPRRPRGGGADTYGPSGRPASGILLAKAPLPRATQPSWLARPAPPLGLRCFFAVSSQLVLICARNSCVAMAFSRPLAVIAASICSTQRRVVISLSFGCA